MATSSKPKPSRNFDLSELGFDSSAAKPRQRRRGAQPTEAPPPPDPHAKTLTCTVSGNKPRFINKQEGFAIWAAVMEVETDRGTEARQITIQGPLGQVNPGESLACTGNWSKHSKHGWGFKVADYESALPQNSSGVASWLESTVDGIGPTFAKAIVAHFGHDQVFEVLDADPTRLREVRTAKGRALPEKQVEKAIGAWADAKAIRQIEVFLFSHGVTKKLAARLYGHYGDDVVTILQQTPYRITEVRMVGFKIADKIALNLGTDRKDPARIKAAILYCLGNEKAEKEGHSFLTLEQLLSSAKGELDISDERAIVNAAGELAKQGQLVLEEDAVVRQRIYSKRWHSTECRVARIVREMLASCERPLFEDPERPSAPEGAAQEEIDKLKLPTDEQWQIMEAVRQNRLSILSGGPGCGKSQSIKLITDLAEQEGLHVELAAPTGKAARRMKELSGHPARTIHRMLEWLPFENSFKRGPDMPIEADLIVIDEASMLSLYLADSVLQAVGPDTHVLLVGDPDQLPPVGVGKVFEDMINSEAVPRVHLTKIFRQAARSMIIQNSRRINRGEKPYERKEEAERALGMKMLNDFFWVPRKDSEATFQMVVEYACTRIPRTFGLDPRTDIMVLSPMKDGKVGLERLNKALEIRLNSNADGSPKEPVVPLRGICVGSRIVQSKNDYDHEIMNGEIGIVIDHNSEKHEALVSLDDGSRELWLPTADMDSFYLAWAMSIHKSQGSQFKAVVTPVSTATFKMLSRALTYTAITRAETLCLMIGEPKALAIAVKHVETRKRNSSLRDRILDASLSGELF